MAVAVSHADESWLRGGSFAVFLVAWQVLALVVDDATLPPPTSVLASLWEHLQSGELPYHLGVTLARVSASFVLAMVIGTAIGIAMGRSRRLDSALDGLLVLALNIPALVTIILCYIWFGLTEAAAVTSVEVRLTSAGPRFAVDRPFLFLIHDDHSGAILFAGKITDPPPAP